MSKQRVGAPPAGQGGIAKRLRPWRRLVLALAGTAVVAGGVGCGDPGDIELSADSQRTDPYATVTMPAAPPPSWTLPPEGVQIVVHSERAGLVFAAGEEALTVALPAPPEAAGAGRIALRVLCDGTFAFRVIIGEHESQVVRGNDTRRRWKELQFPLPAPLANEALATPMRIERVSAERPVLLQAIKFLP